MGQALQGVEFFLEVNDRLPTWVQSVIPALVSVALILFLIKHIFKSLTDPDLINAAKTLGGVARRTMFGLLRGIFSPLESPIERPRTKFFLECLSVVHSYISAIIFFLFILMFGFAFFVSKSEVSFLQGLGALGVFLVLFYFMVFFRVEADRSYLRAKELWSKLKDGR